MNFPQMNMPMWLALVINNNIFHPANPPVSPPSESLFPRVATVHCRDSYRFRRTLSVSDSHCFMHPLSKSPTVRCVRCIFSKCVVVAFRTFHCFILQVIKRGNDNNDLFGLSEFCFNDELHFHYIPY